MEAARALLAILVLLLFASSSNAEEELLKKVVNERLKRTASGTSGNLAIAPVLKRPRIVYGDEAVPNSWPWQCRLSLNLGGRYKPIDAWCGASVINNNFLVTAAHCVFYKNARIRTSKFEIFCGDHNKNTPESTEQQATACEITVHPDYNPHCRPNDIAIIELTKPLEYTNFVSPVCLPSADVPDGTDCVVTGWGDTKNTGDDSVLRQAVVPIVSQSTCITNYPGLTFGNLCAGQAAGGACFGDSGGPLVCKNVSGIWELQGVVSYGPSLCAPATKPAVYTRVTTYMPWINKNTQVENCGSGSKVGYARCAKYLYWARHKRLCRKYKAKFPNWN